jgi:hypothetical protein
MHLSRREALRLILAATAAGVILPKMQGAPTQPGLSWDPDMLKKDIPWDRLMTPAEKRATTALCDILIPADDYGPAASAVGVPDFLDEWISAPYDGQVRDRKTIRDGLAWLDQESVKRTTKTFADSTLAQQTALVTETFAPDTPARKAGYSFMKLFRDRTAGGYYTTREGWKAIGYTGNVPQAEFAGPSDEILKRIGVI